jgi:hypothetical protein
MVSESKKERWKAKREEQREQQAALERTRSLKRIAVWAAVGVIALVLAFLLYKKVTGPGKHDALAQCLTEKGMTMYGTDWCPHCQRQKQLFGKSFAYIDYVNCDLGPRCDEAGVQAFPTWGMDGKLLPSGVKPLAELAKISGCPMP